MQHDVQEDSELDSALRVLLWSKDLLESPCCEVTLGVLPARRTEEDRVLGKPVVGHTDIQETRMIDQVLCL